jgi:hypothetical protein
MNQAMTTGTWEPFNEWSNEYGNMRAVGWIKQWLRAHESVSMIQAGIKVKKSCLIMQAMTTGTWESFNISSNDYGHMSVVQWIKQWLRSHERRSMNKIKTAGTRETFNGSSNDYEHMRAVQSIKQWLRAYARRSMIQAMTICTWEPFNESTKDYGHMRATQWIKQ